MKALSLLLPAFGIIGALAGTATVLAAENRFTYHPSGELLAVTSSGATVPSIYRAPQPVQTDLGQIVALSVGATGTAPLTYQWYKDSEPVPDANGPALLLAPFAATHVGSYTVSVTNAQGTVTSAAANVSMTVAVDPLSTLLGTPGQAWRRGGTSYWKPVTEPAKTHNGSPTLSTGEVVNDDSFIETDIVGPKTLRFWYKITGIGSYFQDLWGGRFNLRANGIAIRRMANYRFLQAQVPDDTWLEMVIDIPPGPWTFRWQNLGPDGRSGKGSSLSLADFSLTTPEDSDHDGLSDDWERRFYVDLSPLPTDNPDGDSSDHLQEYKDMSLPNQGSYLEWAAFNYHIFTTTQGTGTVAVSPPEHAPGYSPSVPYAEYGNDPLDWSFVLSATPGPGQVFAAWIDQDHGVEYATNPLTQFNFKGEPLPATKNYFNIPRSRRLTAVFTPAVTLADALDTPGRIWTTGGDGPWVGQAYYKGDGVDGARSGSYALDPPGQSLQRNRNSWIATEITGPAKVTWRQFQGGENMDLSVTMDQQGPESMSAWYEHGIWASRILYVPPGTHTLTWNVRDFGYALPSVFVFDMFSITTAADTDHDGMADEWEMQYFSSLDHTGTEHSDNDSVSDLEEFQRLTNPTLYGARIPLQISAVGGGTATLSPVRSFYLFGGYYNYQTETFVTTGEMLKLDAVPDTGRRFDEWQDGNGVALRDQHGVRRPEHFDYPLIFPPADYAVKAIFSPLLGEALDVPARGVINLDRLWRTRTTITNDGIDSAETASLQGSEIAAMSIQIQGPAVVSFWWKCSGQTDKFVTRVDVDANEGEITGETDWRRRFVQIPTGQHYIAWAAYCNSSVGTNKAWVDQVQIDVDIDQNGLGDEWEIQYFGASGVDAGGDFDLDGTTNQEEFADHTHPKQASSAAYRLTLLSEELGAAAMSPVIGPHPPGTPITLTADPAFIGWTGDATGTANPLVVTLDRNRTVTATFNPIALGTDNTQLLWTTGGSQPWVLENPALFSVPTADLARSAGPTLTDGQQSWAQTTVTGPCSVIFNAYMVSGTSSPSSYKSRAFWSLDGVEKGQLTPIDNPYGHNMYVSAGVHTIRWTFQRGAGEGAPNPDSPIGAWLDEVKVIPQPGSLVSLAEAMDATDRTWTVSGQSPWLGGPSLSHDGTDAAFAWGTPINGQSVLETTVAGAGLVSFWWKVYSHTDEHFLRFLADGQSAVPAITGDVGWIQVTYEVLGAGSHVLRWVYAKNEQGIYDYDGAWVDEFSFVPAVVVPLAQALDTTGLTWTAGGNTAWTGIVTTNHDGVDAAQSGPVNDGQESTVQTTVTGPGMLDFWWKVSSKSVDPLIVYLDGARSFPNDAISGEVDWTQRSLTIPSGSHVIKWRYVKSPDSSSVADPGHQNRAWLDQVEWTPQSGAPEISIEKSAGGVINDGGTYDFGSIAAGSTTVLTLVIKNLGKAKLNNIAASLLDTVQTDFVLLSLPPDNVPAGQSANFQVKLNPTTPGVKSVGLKVLSNDASEGSYDILLASTVVPPPEIAIEQPAGANLIDGMSTVNFGSINTGSASALTFTVKNAGTSNLGFTLPVQVDGDHKNDFIVTGPAAATLAGNKTTTFTVKFSPGNTGLRQAVLRLTNTDLDESPFDVNLSGNGVAAKPVITMAPLPQLIGTGESASFTAAAVGSGTLTWKWLKNGAAIAGAPNAAAHAVTSAALTSAGGYSATASNGLGAATSVAAKLGVVSLAPTSVVVNEAATLTLKASAAAPAGTVLTYQWKKAGGNLANGGVAPAQVISGATSATLAVTKAVEATGGTYTSMVGMGALGKESGAFNVTVRLKPVVDNPGQLAWSVSQTVTEQVTAENSPALFTFTNLPLGVTGDRTTGKLSGKPNAATVPATKPFTVVASNLAGKSAPVNVSYTVTALPANVVGMFNGLIDRNTTLSAPVATPPGQKLRGHGGRISTLLIGSNGIFTATLQVDEKTYAVPAASRLEAAVGSHPTANVVLSRGTGVPSLRLQFTVDKDSGELTGTLGDGSAAQPVSVRAWRQTAPTTAQAGVYTAVLQVDPAVVGTDPSSSPPGSAANVAYPQGLGYVIVSIDAKGVATWGGKLSDGSGITGASSLGPQGHLPFHQFLYGTVAATAGSAHGWMVISPDSGTTPANGGRPLLDGAMDWSKLPQLATSTSRIYRAGIPLHNLTAVGGRYAAPATGTIIFGLPDVSPPAVNTRLEFREGGLLGPVPLVPAVMAGDLSKNWRISKTHLAALPAGILNPAAVTFTLAPAIGTFTGTFMLKNDPDATDLVPPTALRARGTNYYGVLVPRLGQGFGHFLLPVMPALGPPKTTLATSPQLSGKVTLKVAP